MRYLVTGASGYIGGRLIPRLLEQGVTVRVLVRHPEAIAQRTWYNQVEVHKGDASDLASLEDAMAEVDVAYYLMHSLGTGKSFDNLEEKIATTFATAADATGIPRIVYLGGLSPDGATLSPHLRSRARVGQILQGCSATTIELRAGVIIGSGSASFEMLRYLTERLPAMITPRWVRTKTQPIAVRDVLYYLENAATVPVPHSRHFDIGGPDVMTYQTMMSEFAEVAGLRKRIILPINLLSPGLSSHWVGLVTPVPRGVARPLVESLRIEAVRTDHDIEDFIPNPPGGLLPYRTAVSRAIARVQEARVDTRWSGASPPGASAEPLPTDPEWSGGSLYSDTRSLDVSSPPDRVWEVVEQIGGTHGYYAANFLWEVRGAFDRLIGGVGLRRGRRDPQHVRVGDALDFWRVEEVIRPELLRLRAEMKLPGRAWLEWQLEPSGEGTQITQRALFYPRGLAGQLYWWSIAPFHAFVFRPMLNNIARRAQLTPAFEAQAATTMATWNNKLPT